MSVTAVAEDLDLDRWVAFTGEPDDCCDRDSCVPLEAVALAWWDRHCSCPDSRNPEKLCAGHRDETLALDRKYGVLECHGCGDVLRLVTVEPIR